MEVISLQLQNTELLEALITLAHSPSLPPMQVSVFATSWYIFSFTVLRQLDTINLMDANPVVLFRKTKRYI